MADPSNTSESPDARRRRPPTIELTATEVARAPAEPTPEATDASAAPGARQGTTQSAPESPAPAGAPHGASERTGVAWLPQDARSPLGLGVAIAAGVLVILALLWLAGVIGGRPNELAGRLAKVEAQLRELAARPVPAGENAKAIEELTTRIARLESKPAVAPPPLADPALANRLAAAENATRAFADNIGSLNRRTDDLAAALREARQRLDAVTASLAELQSAARAAAPTAERGEIELLANRISALERAAAAIEAELAKRASGAGLRAIELALAALALRAAVERGEPFAAELAAVRARKPDKALAALEPFAAAGLPSDAALARELAALMPALRRAVSADAPEDGFFDRLKASAQRLVRIQPVGERPGDDPAALIARIEVRAAHADIPGALAELAKLPAHARAPAQAWIGKAQARNAALEASRHLATDAIDALAVVP